jgi:hypothetical protein
VRTSDDLYADDSAYFPLHISILILGLGRYSLAFLQTFKCTMSLTSDRWSGGVVVSPSYGVLSAR